MTILAIIQYLKGELRTEEPTRVFAGALAIDLLAATVITIFKSCLR